METTFPLSRLARKYLQLTALVDHDVIDGAPAARSMARLDALMRSCDGLSETV